MAEDHQHLFLQFLSPLRSACRIGQFPSNRPLTTRNLVFKIALKSPFRCSSSASSSTLRCTSPRPRLSRLESTTYAGFCLAGRSCATLSSQVHHELGHCMCTFRHVSSSCSPLTFSVEKWPQKRPWISSSAPNSDSPRRRDETKRPREMLR